MDRRPSFVPVPEWELSYGEPRAALGKWPTPIERMDNVSHALGTDVWVKREDLSGAWGGNKVRKLEFWLARSDVWKKRSVIVSGAGSSTWTAAAALHARNAGLEVTAALAGEIPEDRQKLYSELGVRLVHHSNLNALPLVVAKARVSAGRRASLLPMGGSGWPGDLGSFICGLEIADDDFPRPSHVLVATGTSGTAAGIAAALAHRKNGARIVAVRVVPRPLGTTRVVARHARKLLKEVNAADASEPAIVGEDGFFGEGYGKAAPGVEEAMELAATDGIELERTYTAKAFAALIAQARSGSTGPLLFVHTAAGPRPPTQASAGRIVRD